MEGGRKRREEKRWENQQKLVKETGDKGWKICPLEAEVSDPTGEPGYRKPNMQLLIACLLTLT